MLVAVILFLIKINIGFGYPNTGPINYYSPVCTSRGCIKSAYTIMESMNEKANPCDDFYEYACGNWKKKYTLTQEIGDLNPFVQLSETLQVDVRNLLENDKVETFSPFVKTKDYHKSCMNLTAINEVKGQPLIDFLRKTMGGWPIIEKNWNQNSFNWIEVLANLRISGFKVLIMSYVGPDAKKIHQNILSFDQTNFGISGEYLKYTQYKAQRQAYFNYVAGMAEVLIGQKLSQSQMDEVSRILNFETRLISTAKAQDERLNFTRLYNPMTVKEIHERYAPNIDFNTYFKILFPETPLKSSDIVLVNEVEFYSKLGELIKNTTRRTVANYIGWRVIQRLGSFLSEEVQQVQSKFVLALTGSVLSTERWRTCVQTTNTDLQFATGKLYTDEHFTQESKKSIDSLIQDLRKAFKELLIADDWMDQNTKTYALKKLNAIITQVGYPEKYNNLSALEEEFNDINVNADTFFENKISVLKSLTKAELKKLLKPVDRTIWVSGPADINAKNDILRNSLLFPAAFLQPPIFDADRPRSLNYGSVGMVIGHEITHGFDNEGKQFGIEGNLEQWWSESANKHFKIKADCLVDQYNKFYLPEVNLNVSGTLTLAENIADNGGLKQAYKAFKLSQQQYGTEALLPGLSYNHDQLFFLSFANTWCGIIRNQQLRYNIISDVHSPGKFRVLGVLSNSQDFQRAFNCPNNSPMVNQAPCNVW